MAAILFGINALISSLGYNELKFNVHVFRFVNQSALREQRHPISQIASAYED